MKNTFNNVYVELLQRRSGIPQKDFTKITKYYLFNGEPTMNNYYIKSTLTALNALL